ncbi:MAG: hypothetical protein Q8900_00425 [Bacillota bacterium]|nr:hypothetical protein [Bacillota bacterium]
MKILISLITKVRDNTKYHIQQYGRIKGLFRSSWYNFLALLVIFWITLVPFKILSFIFTFFSPKIQYDSLMMFVYMSNIELIIGAIIIEIGLYLYTGIPLLNNKSKQRVISYICVSVLTLGGIFMSLNGVNKYCYIKEQKDHEQFVIAARYGFINKEIIYKPSDIDFVNISDEICYGQKSNGKSTIRTGPYQSYNFKIYLKNNKCLEMQALKLDNCDYLYEYLTQNNVPIVYEGKTKFGINESARYSFLDHN